MCTFTQSFSCVKRAGEIFFIHKIKKISFHWWPTISFCFYKLLFICTSDRVSSLFIFIHFNRNCGEKINWRWIRAVYIDPHVYELVRPFWQSRWFKKSFFMSLSVFLFPIVELMPDGTTDEYSHGEIEGKLARKTKRHSRYVYIYDPYISFSLSSSLTDEN